MYHCLACVVSTIGLRDSYELREEEVDGLVEDHVAAPQVDREDDRGHEDHDGGADHFVAVRPGDLLHLRVGLAEEVARGGPPLARFGYDCCAAVFVHSIPR